MMHQVVGPLIMLPLNCDNCRHFDGENWCALPSTRMLIAGYIQHPKLVVCALHEPKEGAEP